MMPTRASPVALRQPEQVRRMEIAQHAGRRLLLQPVEDRVPQRQELGAHLAAAPARRAAPANTSRAAARPRSASRRGRRTGIGKSLPSTRGSYRGAGTVRSLTSTSTAPAPQLLLQAGDRAPPRRCRRGRRDPRSASARHRGPRRESPARSIRPRATRGRWRRRAARPRPDGQCGYRAGRREWADRPAGAAQSISSAVPSEPDRRA